MKDFLKGKLVTGLIVIATVILAGVAIFTAVRLYQLRTEPVAPNAPTRPRAEAPKLTSCQVLAFNLTSTPTPTSEITPTGTLTVTPTPTTGNTSTPTPTNVVTQPPSTSTPSPTPSGGILPDAGVSTPTILGVSLGTLIILGALLLAF